MNERFDWRAQAAKMCTGLSETFAFLTEVNHELGKPRETAKNFYKAIDLELKAKAFRQEAKKQQTPTR